MGDVTQRASVIWIGTIARGGGTVSGASGALVDLPIDLPTRMGETGGKTSPEELLAGAHAACFAMALGSVLARVGKPPETLTVTAAVTLDTTEGQRRISLIELVATGAVPNADGAQFASAVAEAEKLCLISRTLQGNVEIIVQSDLQ